MRIVLTALSIICLLGCGKKDDFKLPPSKSSLIFPLENAICVAGTTKSETHSIITFKWTKTDNTKGYELNIKNLLTNALIIQESSEVEKPVELLKNTPYSWYIVSNSGTNGNSTKSDIWKFYNSGEGTLTYPPFPAEIIAPKMNDYIFINTVNLEWKGSSLGNNIVSYDIYLGGSNNPPLYRSEVKESKLDNVPIIRQSKYYWKVVTRDINSNTSESEVFMFNTY